MTEFTNSSMFTAYKTMNAVKCYCKRHSTQPQHMRTWVLAVGGDFAAMAVSALLKGV
jgi:hypothetical protein